MPSEETDSLLDHIADRFPEALKMDGYDHCILGVMYRFGLDPVIAYDREKVLTTLMSYGMEEDEAVEFFEFNQLGAWMGEGTPCFIEVLGE